MIFGHVISVPRLSYGENQKSSHLGCDRYQGVTDRWTDKITIANMRYSYTGCGQKSGPLKFFAFFSATVCDFSMKFYSFIY